MPSGASNSSTARSQLMEDKTQTGLLHIPAGSALAVNSMRSSIIARGRRDAANTASNQHYRRAVTEYKAHNFTDAAASFRLAADQGHAESQYILSTMYDAGQGIQKDDNLAASWERKAADLGHTYAQANLSFRYYIAGNFDEAFVWCERAAHSNLAWAQYNLGLMYRKGEGVTQSNAEAAHWYRLAATQDFPEAQQKLADLYYLGEGVSLNYKQAAEWYRKAANHGNAEAQFQLGHLYALGQGIEHDYTQSRYWTREAALQGHEQALRELKRREYRDP
jgi:TPR repeat protein